MPLSSDRPTMWMGGKVNEKEVSSCRLSNSMERAHKSDNPSVAKKKRQKQNQNGQSVAMQAARAVHADCTNWKLKFGCTRALELMPFVHSVWSETAVMLILSAHSIAHHMRTFPRAQWFTQFKRIKFLIWTHRRFVVSPKMYTVMSEEIIRISFNLFLLAAFLAPGFVRIDVHPHSTHVRSISTEWFSYSFSAVFMEYPHQVVERVCDSGPTFTRNELIS